MIKRLFFAIFVMALAATATNAQSRAPQQPVSVDTRSTSVGKFDIGVEKRTYSTPDGAHTRERYKFRGGIKVYEGQNSEVVAGGTYQGQRQTSSGKIIPWKAGPTATVRWGPGAGKPKIDNHDGRYGTFCRKNCQ